MTWSLVATFLVMAGALTAAWCGRRAGDVAVGDEGRPVLPGTEAVTAGEDLSEGAAVDLVKRALAIRSPEKMAAYFRMGSTKPVKAVDFLRRLEEVDGEIVNFQWLGRMDANGLRIEGVTLNSRKGATMRQRLALLTPDEAGAWRIDFDSFARVVEPSWSELMAGGGKDVGLLRVVVARDDVFDGRYEDADKWACYAMLSPDREGKMYGYCPRGSARYSAMEEIVSSGLVPSRAKIFRRAVLKVRRNEAADGDRFEIERVLAEDWILSERPFDERF